MNVTETLQDCPGVNVLMHSLFTANGGEVVSPVMVTSIELVFLIITFLVLVLPTGVLVPKFNGFGLNDSVPNGVAVAVGVAVTVAVRVAVAVAVGVAVALAVAVGVAVAVVVEVAVAVADAVAVGVAVAVAVGVAVAVAV